MSFGLPNKLSTFSSPYFLDSIQSTSTILHPYCFQVYYLLQVPSRRCKLAILFCYYYAERPQMSWFDGEPEACSEEGADERDSFLLQETTNTILAVIVSLVRADCGRNTLRTVVAVRTRRRRFETLHQFACWLGGAGGKRMTSASHGSAVAGIRSQCDEQRRREREAHV